MEPGHRDDAGAARDLVETLRRWQDFGALWRVLQRDPDRLTVGLFRCDGGEEVERFSSGDPALRAFVGDRTSSEEPEPPC